jgi:hypothetical protein
VALIWGISLFLLLNLQVHLHKTRARQKLIEQTFSAEDRTLVRDDDPLAESAGAREPIEWFVAVLCIVVTVAGIVTGYAMWQM